jgi:hypothetical protein
MMTTQDIRRNAWGVLAVVAVALLGQGCATGRVPWHYYFQRSPIRVVIMPSENKTEHPDAPVIFNKACEDALKKKGFEVISADQVVTYAASRGLLLGDVAKLKASEIGGDLKADLVLFSSISTWESKYVVVNTQARVAGVSRLLEASTDALVWHYAWNLQQDSSNNNNNGVIGLLVNAAVAAVANSAFDACARLGAQAGAVTVTSIPQPGFAPADSRPPPAVR